MKDGNYDDDIEIKKANIIHHDAEADIFELAHPEGSSTYEKDKVLKSIAFMAKNSGTKDLCVDIGCGTGFVTSFELPLYKTVVAADISRRMLEVVKKRLGHFSSLHILLCDAEFLPFRNEIADLVSVSSVLHHLPKPFDSIEETFRVLKQEGFLYVSREPNFHSMRLFFDFFDQVIVRNFAKLIRRFSGFKSELHESDVTAEGLDYTHVDVHVPTGFHITQLTAFFHSKSFEVVSAYSYHWIHSDSDRGLLQQLLAKTNFVIEKIPFSKSFGRYLSVTARKLERNMHT